MGVAQTKQSSAYKQQPNKYDGPSLGHVSSQRGGEVHQELGYRLEIPVDVRLRTQPGMCDEGLEICIWTSKTHCMASAEIDHVLGDAVVVRSVARRLGAVLDGPDVEDSRDYERQDDGEAPPVLEEDHEDEGRDCEEGADEVEEMAEPVDIGEGVPVIVVFVLVLFIVNPSLPEQLPEGLCYFPGHIQPDIQRHDALGALAAKSHDVARRHGIPHRIAHSAEGLDGQGNKTDGGLALEIVAGLLVVQTWSEHKGVDPRGAAHEGRAAGYGAEVGEGEKAAGREDDAGERGCGPGWDE